MPTASLIIEALRAYPVAAFWLAVLTQAAIWVVLPAVWFDSPPGNLAETLAIGREWQWGSWRGPPLAFWLAEIAYRAAGERIIGVYVLAQAAIVTAFWAMFTIGRAMVGAPQAALAAYLMVGVLAFTLPAPVFGPDILAVALTALALLALWRALGERRRNAWIALAVVLGLLLLTSYWGWVLFLLIPVFLMVTPEGRRALFDIDPWATGVLALLIALPHAIWLQEAGWFAGLDPQDLVEPGLSLRLAVHGPLLLAGFAALIAGLAGLVYLATRERRRRRLRRLRPAPPPVIEGLPRRPLARDFALFFALTLPLMAILVAIVFETGGQAAWAGAFLLAPALALVVGAGRRIPVHQQGAVTTAWIGALIAPPVVLIAVLAASPWIRGIDAETEHPAEAMGAAFTDAFRLRTGRPLTVVIGEARDAYIVALASPDRPRVLDPVRPERTPWVREADALAHGAVAIWSLDGKGDGGPPAALRVRFPQLSVEPVESFRLPGGGHDPELRIGWGFLAPDRPAAARRAAAHTASD